MASPDPQLVALVESVEHHHRVAHARDVVIHGFTLRVEPGVFDPTRSHIGDLLAQYMSIRPGTRVLDLGTGTGVLALVAARRGATAVVASDRHVEAAECARANVRRHGLERRIDVRAGDLFDVLESHERFDTITFNFPFVPWEPTTEWQRHNFDPGHELLRRFIGGVGDHLAEDGEVVMTWADIGDTALLRALAAEHGLECSTLVERQRHGTAHYVLRLAVQRSEP